MKLYDDYSSYTFMSAESIEMTKRINFNTDIPLLVKGTVSDRALKKLIKAYGENAEVVKGQDHICLKDVGVCEIFVILPKKPLEKERFNINDLMCIMDRLMSDDGCPWDRAQTHQSIKSNLLEEAEEAARAIENNDIENMREEFGDVLLQSVFQSCIAEKGGEFDFSDVITGLCNKLISRHTHVFGEGSAATPEDALRSWKAAKAKEKNGK